MTGHEIGIRLERSGSYRAFCSCSWTDARPRTRRQAQAAAGAHVAEVRGWAQAPITDPDGGRRGD